eukprot:COSAG01_NODE_7791_length_3055_cov_4.866373_5_plen_57_part_00
MGVRTKSEIFEKSLCREDSYVRWVRYGPPHPSFSAENCLAAKTESAMGIASGWRVE